MRFSSESAALVLGNVRQILDRNEPDAFKAEYLWRSLIYMRAGIFAALLHNTIGTKVHSGPFKGMQLMPEAMTENFGALLAGFYEHELHATVERAIAQPYDRILNIGCAFGYYSTGLALRMPNVKVHAFDIDPVMQQNCRHGRAQRRRRSRAGRRRIPRRGFRRL